MDGVVWNRLPQDVLVMYDEKKVVDIEESTIQMTQQGDTYRYTIEELSNLTGENLDEFTMTDYLPEEVYLTEFWTGTYNESLLYDVEYMTNRSDDWISWERGLSTEENHHLLIPDELRTKNEHITKLRINFGTVGDDFKKIKSPVYMTYVSSEARGAILNEVELTAEYNGGKLRDKDRTKTLLYLKSISGYDTPNGGGNPLYEVLETEKMIIEKETEISKIRRTTANGSSTETQEEMEIIEDEDMPLTRWRKKIGVQTGDDTPIALFAMLAAFAAMGLAVLLFFRRRKKR